MTTPLMNQLGIVKRNIERADRSAVERLAGLGSATVHEAMGRVGLMKPYMRPIWARRPGRRHAPSPCCCTRATTGCCTWRPNRSSRATSSSRR
jgi:hypothetical protein